MLKNNEKIFATEQKVERTKSFSQNSKINENKNQINENKAQKLSFEEELEILQNAEEEQENKIIEENSDQLLSLNNFLPLSFYYSPLQTEEKTSNYILEMPAENQQLQDEPIVNFDKEKLQVSIKFNNPEAAADLQSINIEYNPNSRSIAAEIITSVEAAKILQSQVNQLEKNLAKHNIKLKNLRISPAESNESREKKQHNKRKN